MPKQPIQEIFSQGLVTSRPAHMLAQGELTRADHCVYRENNVALQRAPDHGYYSPSSPAILGTNTITGILMGNFEAEEYPDQLICRVEDDLFSSNITGASNNTFEPITSPGKALGTFGETPIVECEMDESTTVTVVTPGDANGIALVGRAIYSDTAFPRGQNTVITAITEVNGNVTSFTVSTAAAATVQEDIYFAPKCALTDAYVFNESIGFSVSPIDSEVTTMSNDIAACRHVASQVYQIKPPASTPTAFNLYATVGRRISVRVGASTTSDTALETPTGDAVEFATIVKVESSGGNVIKLYMDNKLNTANASSDTLHVRFLAHTSTLVITAVDDVVEEPYNNTPVYTSCYFNWFPAAEDHVMVFSGGLARSYSDNGGRSFDGMSWDGTMFLWDGQNTTRRLEYRNRVSFVPGAPLTKSIVARPAGLLPVVSAPTLKVEKRLENEINLGVWNANLPEGIYWLLITEAYIPTKNQLDEVFNPLLVNNLLESAYLASTTVTGESTGEGLTGDPTAAPIVAEASAHAGRPIPFSIDDKEHQYLRITFPAPRNDGTDGYMATHWCVYIAGITTNYMSPPPFSSFTRTSVVPIKQYTSGQIAELLDYQKTRIYNTATGWDATYDWGQVWDPVAVDGQQAQLFGHEDYPRNSSGHPIRIYRAYSGASESERQGYAGQADWVVSGGPLEGSYAGLAVSGIRVGLSIWREQRKAEPVWTRSYWYNANVAFTIDCGTLTSQTYKKDERRQGTNIQNYGGPTDTWGILPEDDWSTFRVRLTKMTSARGEVIEFLAPIVTFYYTTTTINFNGPAYRCVTYRSQVGAVDISDPSTLPPPRATMGDTFQGSLVLNDITNPSFIRYSLPDQPERFPQPYRMRMGTKRKGKITALKAFKQVLIVGMERAIKRINYLPKETDTDFTQGGGLSHEDISSTHGIVGPNAITDFDMPGMGPMIAYVSTVGLRMTNGADSRALNTDVILKDYIHPNFWDKCILKAFPNQKWLVLYYVPKDSTHGVLSKCFFYSYSEDHIKSGASIVLSGNPALTGPLPVTGPCDCFVTDACDIIINSSPQVATTDGDFVFIEDSSEDWGPIQTVTGPDDATKVNRVNVPYIKTRDIFPAGFTQEANIGSVYLLHETKGNQYVVTGTTSTQGSTTLAFNSGWGGNTPKIGERVIHGGWDSPPSVLSLDDEDGTTITVSAPAVRAFTGSATFDTGVVLVRVNAAQFSEDEVPILTEYRSTSVGVGQPFIMDATANRFSMEIIKTENPNTGDLNDLQEDMSIIGIVYHASPAGETNLHAN